MRLFNAISIYDLWIVAHDPMKAREALLEWMKTQEANPNELTCTETKRAASIRETAKNQPPLVAADITDEEFQTIKGKTTFDMFLAIYTKEVDENGKPK